MLNRNLEQQHELAFASHNDSRLTKLVGRWDICDGLKVNRKKLENNLDSVNLIGIEPIKYFDVELLLNTEKFLRDGKYNLGYLEEGHVVRISRKFGENQLQNPYVINAANAAKGVEQVKGQITYLISAMIHVSRGESVQLFISDNNHWTTCSILPTSNNRFVIVGMDSLSSCSDMTEITELLVKIGTRLGMNVVKPDTQNFYNLSVAGQQHGACCGFAAACNGFSLQKTYKSLQKNSLLKEDGTFDIDGFRKALLPNIVYRTEKDKTILYGNTESIFRPGDFVMRAGGSMLQKISGHEVQPLSDLFLFPQKLQNIFDDNKKKNLFVKILSKISNRQVYMGLELAANMQEVIEAAFPSDGSEPKVDISIWQRIIVFLYKIPLIRNLIDFIDKFIVNIDVVDVTREVNNFRQYCDLKRKKDLETLIS